MDANNRIRIYLVIKMKKYKILYSKACEFVLY